LPDIIQLENQFYVLATSSLADDRTRVLKYGEGFAVFNRLGDIEGLGMGEQGLYHRGTRYLSRLALRMDGTVPQLLRSTIHEDDAFFTVDMMNSDVYEAGRLVVARGSLHLFRSKFLWRGVCYEKIRISNFGLAALDTSICVQFAADFADVFQVRGMERQAAGTTLPPEVRDGQVTFCYRGRDHELRRTRLQFSPEPATLTADSAAYSLSLAPREEASLTLAIACEHENDRVATLAFDDALNESVRELEQLRSRFCAVTSPHQHFNRWFSRSRADVIMMISGNPQGAYPYAGVPWFSTVFGRDALITAMQCLWAAPWIAESVLKFLALHQAVETIPEQEAEPGKILHEMRHGEMANLKEVPFGLYYGSVDATPLFVWLAGRHFELTEDRPFLESIWPNILAALDWVDHFGDADGDGFVEYQAKSEKGLTHQGWKDSGDAVFHADGSLAAAPIALCEVQGYVYAAKMAASQMAASLGRQELSNKLRVQAKQLQQKFENEFWDEALGCYVLALDGQKQACRVRTSNAGHALWTGIASPERAGRLKSMLSHESLNCGWGIRTVSSDERRYNPMSYHNGSVWPHDNSIIAAGLAGYGFKEEAGRLLTSILEASTFVQLNRLPELFCGFHKRPGVDGPTLYPVACSPQAWSAGAAYLFLNACLGISFLSPQKTIRFSAPHLPAILDRITLNGLQVGGASADLRIYRVAERIEVETLRSRGNVRVEVVE